MSENNSTPPRRTTRLKRLSLKALEAIENDSEISSESNDEDSEYSSGSSSSTSDSSESEQVNLDNEKSKKEIKKLPSKSITTNHQKIRQHTNNKNYSIDTEEYFNSNARVKTSNNTLEKLDIPRLQQYEIQKLLENQHHSIGHQNAIKQLMDNHKQSFNKWYYILHQDFSLLLYGLGSKKQILNDFHEECLRNKFTVLIVNGFFPTLSIKNILDIIITDLLELTSTSVHINPNETCDLIINEFNRINCKDLYLIIHNIDGEMLRAPTTQTVLARLSAVKKIHLIASIDHINAPLIWDHKKLAQFNFIWWDVTTFQSYTSETAYEKSIMVQQSGNLALSSLRNVFMSLTKNSKAIYLTIVRYQIENYQQFYSGMAFKDLYMKCRESFIVSSDLALRAQLSEFHDHKMVKTKRSMDDGTEYLIIPISLNLLQKFLEENNT